MHAFLIAGVIHIFYSTITLASYNCVFNLQYFLHSIYMLDVMKKDMLADSSSMYGTIKVNPMGIRSTSNLISYY